MADPYRTAEPPEPETSGPDLDPEITTLDGHRTRALLLDEAELARGGERTLEHRELVRCESCRGAGCSVCAERGATIRKSGVVVRWKAGAADGELVTFEARGDVPGLRRGVALPVFPEGRGDLLVRLTTKKKEVRTIENADKRLRKRQRAFLEELAELRSRRRARRRKAMLAAAVMLVGLGGLAGVSYLRERAIGEPCDSPHDCRSGMCVESSGFILGKGGFRERRCTARCTADSDCPAGMRCTDVDDYDSLGPTGKTIRACGRH